MELTLTNQNKQNIFCLQNGLNFLCLLFVAIFSLHPTLFAATTTEQFTSEVPLEPGTLVSLNRKSPDSVIPSHLNNGIDIVGVVVEEGAGAVGYTKVGSKLSVAKSGNVIMFVVDEGRGIKTGDNISASSIEGVGVRATPGSKDRLVGVVLRDFDSNEAKEFEAQLSADTKKVRIGTIEIRLYDEPTYATDFEKEQAGLVGFLSDLAGKDISYIRSALSVLIFVVSMVVTTVYLSIALRSSFISLGRNPLASAKIFNGMTRVTVFSVGIVALGTSLAYMVLVV